MSKASTFKPETLAAHGLYPGDPATGGVVRRFWPDGQPVSRAAARQPRAMDAVRAMVTML